MNRFLKWLRQIFCRHISYREIISTHERSGFKEDIVLYKECLRCGKIIIDKREAEKGE
jgi:hypothetical protein